MSLPPLFHGTYELFPIGTTLRGRGDPYHEEWCVLGHYDAIHAHIPDGMIAHKDGVFMCELDDIDACGGATENVSLMRPIGEVQRHDLNWSGKIEILLGEGAAIDDPRVQEMCLNYWHGVPTEDPLWEYIAREVVVVASSTFEDADVLYDWVETPEDEGCEM